MWDQGGTNIAQMSCLTCCAKGKCGGVILMRTFNFVCINFHGQCYYVWDCDIFFIFSGCYCLASLARVYTLREHASRGFARERGYTVAMFVCSGLRIPETPDFYPDICRVGPCALEWDNDTISHPPNLTHGFPFPMFLGRRKLCTCKFCLELPWLSGPDNPKVSPNSHRSVRLGEPGSGVVSIVKL